VADALARLHCATRPALAAPSGPLGALVATANAHADSSLGARATRSARAEAPSSPPSEVRDEHAATWRLVTRAKDGDGEAFGQLYDAYVGMVYRFIYFRVNDRALAEDFTSETFLRALRRISSIDYQGRDIGAWFMTIARNLILDHKKSARARLEVPTAEDIEGEPNERSPEAAVLDLLTSERLMAAVRQLGDEQRECVILRFVQGFSVSETAAVMGKNDGSVKALQHRAIRKLAELIGDELR
jgi:RNA polymerase sigma-70 factor (ECF subfamily)